MSNLVHFKNPFNQTVDRDIRAIRPGTRIDTVLRNQGVLKGRGAKRRITHPYYVMVNGEPVLQAQWHTRAKKGDLVAIVTLPKGGGSGSNPLQMVAMVALVALAVWSGGLAAGAYATATGTAVTATGAAAVGAAVSGAIMIGGSLLVNMMFPPPSQSVQEISRETASPTYTIGAQGNSARLLEAIPVLYGRHIIYPDYGSQPYAEIRGNQQYLYQLYVLTQGELDIEKIRIEDEDINSFGEIEYQVVRPGQKVTLFPDNVASSTSVSGQTLLGPNEPGYVVVGPFSANPPGSVINNIGLDITFPGGAYAVNQSNGKLGPASAAFTAEYQAINDAGVATGPWNPLISRTETFSTNTPQMLSYKQPVALGRYQVRLYRSNNAPTDTRTVSAIQWAGLKGYIEAETNYGDVTLLAMIIRSSNNINQSTARRVNVIGTRRLRTWDPVNGWTQTISPQRNPAWAIADMLTNKSYGRGLDTSRISIGEIYRLSQVWAARGDTFDAVFDSTTQFWDALTKACQCGRALPMYYAGTIDIIRNEPKTLITAMFQPQNILQNSFTTDYLFAEPSSPDHVVMEYIDPETWRPATVECVLPGGTTDRPANITLFGCTNRDQAWREGMSRAAANRDQRRLINIATSFDGYIPKFGDLVKISHDVPQWGYSGRVLGFMPSTGLLTTSEPLPFVAGESHQLAFRRRDGSPHGPFTVTRNSSLLDNQVIVGGTVAQRNEVYISEGNQEELTQYQFGPVNRSGILALVVSGQPNADGDVQLAFTNYAESVHTAENGGDVPIPGPESNLPITPVAPIVDRVTVVLTHTPGEQTIVASPANGAIYYEFAVRQGSGEWSNLGISQDPFFTVFLAPGQWSARVRGVGRLPGPWATWSGDIAAGSLPLPLLASATTTPEMMAIRANWVFQAVSAMQVKAVEIHTGLTNVLGNAALTATVPAPARTYTVTNLGRGERRYFWFRTIDNADRIGPWYNGAVGILGESISDPRLIMDYIDGQINEGSLAPSLIEKIEAAGNQEEIYAAINDLETQTADEFAATAQRISTVESGVGDLRSTVQTNAEAVTSIDGKISAQYSIKVQAVGDKTVLAGIGIGVDNSTGVLQSQVLVLADRFAVGQANNGNSFRSVFIIDGNDVFMDSAFIKNGTIDMLKIRGDLYSANHVWDQSGWILTQSGVFQLNGSGGGNRMRFTNGLFQVFDSSNRERVRLGIW